MSHVSHSEVETFLTCRRKHWYSYSRRLQPKRKHMALAYGTAGHTVLQAFYDFIIAAGSDRRSQRRAFNGAVESAYAAFEELKFEEAEGQMELESLLFDYYFPNEPFVRNGWLIETTEVEQDLEIEEGLSFKFVIDLVVVDPEGRRAVVDHKFKGRFDSAEGVTLLPQISKYIGALRGGGMQVHYGIYNELKTAKVRGAKLTKQPLIKLIEQHYVAHPDAPLAKMTVDKLVEIAEDLKLNIYAGPTLDQAMSLLKLKPNGEQVINVFSEQIAVSEEILARRELSVEEQEETAYRVFNPMICPGCSFKTLCEVDLVGGNSKLIEATDYETRPKRVLEGDTPEGEEE